MNPRAEIWNILHDGGIAGMEGSVPGDLTLRIKIPYLRQMFSESGEDIFLRLSSCTRFAMKIWEEDLLTSDPERIVASDTEILSTESEDIPVRIVTTHGAIEAEFQSFALALDDGQPITFEEICGACERYWTRWEEDGKAVRTEVHPSAPPNGGPATQTGNSTGTEGPPSVS
jgi:hypothetical protein